MWALASDYCCCWVAPSCLALCDPMDCITLGLPVSHHLPKFAQVHFHCIGDAIQPSHPLTHSSPSALNLSQHQGFFQWVSYLHRMTKILEFQLQHRSFQWVFGVDFPQDWPIRSPCCPRDSQESSPAPQFKGLPAFISQLHHLVEQSWANHLDFLWLSFVSYKMG